MQVDNTLKVSLLESFRHGAVRLHNTGAIGCNSYHPNLTIDRPAVRCLKFH